LFANLTDRRPSATVAGGVIALPVLQAGQQWTVGLRFTEANAGLYAETFPPIMAIRASIGSADARPSGGTFRLQVGANSANTTAALEHDCAPSRMAAALNALGVGHFTVDFDAGSYLVRRSDGAQAALVVRNNRLLPMSAVRVRSYLVDGEWVQELRLIQSPLAFSGFAQPVQPNQPFVTTLVDGYTSPDNSWFVNEVQQLVIPNEFRGLYRLTFDYQGGIGGSGLPRRTRILSLEDGPTELQAALNEIFKGFNGFDGSVEVTNPANNVARLTFGGEAFEGGNLPQLEVEAFPLPGDEGDWTFTIDLNRVEMWAALRERAEIDVPFEVEADVWIDRAEPDLGWRTVKLWSLPIKITRPAMYEGLGEAQAIDWLRPISARSYVPFDPDQIITGQQHWVGTIGFEDLSPAYGTAVSFGTAGGEQVFTIDHNLGTEAVQVAVRENEAGGAFVYPRILVDGPDSVSIAFGSAVAQSFGVMITAAGPRSVFQAHTHPLAQVDGLVPVLENLANRVELLEKLLPRAGAAGVTVAVAPDVSFVLPNIGEVLPDVATLDSVTTLAAQVVVTQNATQVAPSGTAVAQEKEKAKEVEAKAKQDPDALPPSVLYRVVLPGVGKIGKNGSDAVVDADGKVTAPSVPAEPSAPALWPLRTPSMVSGGRWPLLLPSITRSSSISHNSGDLPTAEAGGVWQYTGSDELLLPGGGGRKSQKVRTNGYFGYDGRAWYRLTKEGNNYYPAEMERELWRVMLTDVQFPEGAVLMVNGEIRVRMLADFFDDDARDVGRVDFGGQYILRCEAVPVAGAVSLGAVSAPVLLGQTRVTLAPSLETFAWSLNVRKEATGMVSSWMAYRKAQSGGAFTLPAALRLRLVAFDVDDDSRDPRGQVALIMPSTKLEITEGVL
jgi:hypothetical protein